MVGDKMASSPINENSLSWIALKDTCHRHVKRIQKDPKISQLPSICHHHSHISVWSLKRWEQCFGDVANLLEGKLLGQAPKQQYSTREGIHSIIGIMSIRRTHILITFIYYKILIKQNFKKYQHETLQIYIISTCDKVNNNVSTLGITQTRSLGSNTYLWPTIRNSSCDVLNCNAVIIRLVSMNKCSGCSNPSNTESDSIFV